MNRSIVVRPVQPDDVYYPEEDAVRMGETDFHMLALILLREAMEDYFAGQPEVYVASDLFLYYVQGDPSKVRSPDVMVVKGVPRRKRRTFKTWEEKAVPSIVFEIVSDHTWQEDIGPKRQEYAAIGVREYFVFDPEGVYIRPVLQGWRLRGRRYVAVPPAPDGSLVSAELRLGLLPEEGMLRLADPGTGRLVPTRTERAEQAQQRADALATEVKRLRAELAQAKATQQATRRGKKKPS